MSFELGFTIVEIAWVVVASCWILLEKRSPTATLAWIFGLALLPIVGAFVYLMIGNTSRAWTTAPLNGLSTMR